jgi:hypothetical protein
MTCADEFTPFPKSDTICPLTACKPKILRKHESGPAIANLPKMIFRVPVSLCRRTKTWRPC